MEALGRGIAPGGEAGGQLAGELANLENVQQPTMSRIVDALAAGEWVERVADDVDRRVTRVVVTQKAERELARVRVERNAYLAARLALLDVEERAAIVAALPAIEKLLSDPS
jgi:DNA-binding MarR family transcriptional regulator